MKISPIIVLCLLALPGYLVANEKAERIDAVMKQYHQMKLFNGSVLVAENGKIIYKAGHGLADMEWDIPNQADTRFRLGSITKQFTAALIMQLVQEGKLKLENKVTDILPDYPSETGSKITVHHLLRHNSGLPNYTALPGFMQKELRNRYTPVEFLDVFKDLPLDFEPGTSFRYSNSGYFLLGVIIEKITGKAYDVALKERILEPLGMKDTGYDHFSEILPRRARGYQPGPNGWVNAAYLDTSIPYAAGSMYSTVEDLYTWDRALMGEKVLSTAMKEKMFEPGLFKFGYGWIIDTLQVDGIEGEHYKVSHGGGINGFNTLISRYPKDGTLVVLLNNTDRSQLNEMEQNIFKILHDVEPDTPRKPIVMVLREIVHSDDFESKSKEILAHRDQYRWSEGAINQLGYQFVNAGQLKAAVNTFQFNVMAYPESANTYDSLAEAYYNQEKWELSLKNYRKSLELNPENQNAKDYIKRIEAKAVSSGR